MIDEAIEKVFQQIKQDFSGKSIAYPAIGAGLAKGNWETIAAIIDRCLENENHTFVKYLKT